MSPDTPLCFDGVYRPEPSLGGRHVWFAVAYIDHGKTRERRVDGRMVRGHFIPARFDDEEGAAARCAALNATRSTVSSLMTQRKGAI